MRSRSVWGVHSSSAGSRVSELTDTPNLASSYCPRCDPERDPVREILTVCWCDEHRPTCEGADDARAIVGGGVLDSAGGGNSAPNPPRGGLGHPPRPLKIRPLVGANSR